MVTPEVYEMVVVPAVNAMTVPDVEPILATVGFVLVQVPGVVASVKVTVSWSQIFVEPPIAAGKGLTRIVFTDGQLPNR